MSTEILSKDQLARNGLDLVVRGDDRRPARVYTPIDDVMLRLRFLSSAESSAPLQAVEHLGETIPMTHWLVHQISMAGETTGEVVDRTRMVVRSFDGKLYSTVSAYALSGLELICECLGVGPYDPPVEVHFEMTKTRRGQKVLLLVAGPGSES